MPDATGLELLAQELGEAQEGSVLGTTHFRGQAAIHVRPDTVVEALRLLRGKGYTFLASVHGVDYYPEEPRLGVQYELLDMAAVDRVALAHGIIQLRAKVLSHPEQGWRTRYGGRGTEEIVESAVAGDAAAQHTIGVTGGGKGTSA